MLKLTNPGFSIDHNSTCPLPGYLEQSGAQDEHFARPRGAQSQTPRYCAGRWDGCVSAWCDMTTQGGISGLRVLVVEDDYWVAATLVEIITEAGAEVVGPVDCVRDALTALDSSPHVASLDVQLGSETSFPIADELDRRGVPFIFATGAASMIPAAHASRPTCHKPASRELLIGALSGALNPA